MNAGLGVMHDAQPIRSGRLNKTRSERSSSGSSLKRHFSQSQESIGVTIEKCKESKSV